MMTLNGLLYHSSHRSETEKSGYWTLFRIFLLNVLLVSGAIAELTPGTPAPEFPNDAIWLNGKKLAFGSDLKGKVVLVDFWEYTCINCLRTFPHLKELYARYHKDGFEIIGVHKGEFAFASEVENVARGYKRLKLPYPAIADVKDAVWTLYDCNSWPDSFLIDGDGIIRDVHQGEGDYAKLERDIQRMLKQKHPALEFSGLRIPPDEDDFRSECGPQSEETYIGYLRGESWGGQIANREGFHKDKVVKYQPTARRVKRGFFVEGEWRNEADDFESVRGLTKTNRSSLGIMYVGRDVYAVLGRSAHDPARLVVMRDGKPLPAELRGQDVHTDPEGRTVITIDEPRMYYVVTKEDNAQHELRLVPADAGVRIYSFTFGNRCQEKFDRL